MIFKEKLVLLIPLVQYGIVDGLIDYKRDVTYDDADDLKDGEQRWWHADMNIGNDDDGNEIPYNVTAHGKVDDNGNATLDGLYMSVTTDFDRSEFKIISGIKISECI